MPPFIRLFLGTGVLVALYFAVPVNIDRSLGVRAVLTVICLGVATWLIIQEVKHQITTEDTELWGLALAVVGGLLAFAMADYVIAYVDPGQFVGLETRLDGLYFALTTLTTVGYGDVHAQGQFARAVVSFQLVFNLVVLTTAGSFLFSQVRTRRSASK